MKIRNEVRIAAPLDQTWDALDDIPRLAKCTPGAELLEKRDDGSYVGTVAVKLGPVALKFKGSVTFVEKDRAAGRVVARAKGNEEKGRGAASADVVFTLAGDGEATRATVDSDIQLAGSIAQYGRGAALIQGTAQALMDQFARNLERDLTGEGGKMEGDISAAKVVAKGLWNVGAQMFRKKDTES
jgi:hypothetical protein